MLSAKAKIAGIEESSGQTLEALHPWQFPTCAWPYGMRSAALTVPIFIMYEESCFADKVVMIFVDGEIVDRKGEVGGCSDTIWVKTI